MATISLLNLDSSYPKEDSYHASNTAGVIRYINVSDAASGLSAMERYMGDVTHRFILVGDKINALINSFNSNPYTSGFDDTTYVKTDGTHPFTGPVGGVTPVDAADLATKGYVDEEVAGFEESLGIVNTRVTDLTAQVPLTRVSDWVEYTWSAGEKTALEFTLTPTQSDLTNIILISFIERLNLGTVEEPNYVYMQHMSGNMTNFKVDAIWIDDADGDVLHVLIPNDVKYIDGYPASSGYLDIQSFSERHLRATVVHATGACAV